MKRTSIAAPAVTPFLLFIITAVITLVLAFSARAQTVSFNFSNLTGETLSNPTSLDFGPDGRLYVTQQNGAIVIYTIIKNAPNNYSVTSTEVVNLIQQIPNHNDDGTLAATVNTRQVTGILVTGTPTNPVIYVTSSDPRIGGGFSANNLNLDTNSGTISRLTWNGTQWVKLDLVQGLPRSEENHSINGLQLDAVNNILYIAQGSNTNMGAPSNNFLLTPEYAYSVAILKVDLNAIGNSTYDLPTLDDEDRTNVNSVPGFTDNNDPFGGNNGKNQAMLVAGGPVQIYSPGWRNNYDIVISQQGKMYSFDNGPNAGWGGPPTACSNAQSEPGVTYCDVLIHVAGQGHYAGSPNPTRANRANTFNPTNPQTPIPLGMENPAECVYVPEGSKLGEIESICSSTNGLCEYTASNFGNAMKGDLIAAAFNGKLYRFNLNAAGTAVEAGGQTVLASNFGSTPLDVIAQGDNDIFPGSIWCVTYGAGNITIFEPTDAPTCIGDPNSNFVDTDGDGYKNGDETANGTDYCSPASNPQDFDGDFISDQIDPDDDNDGINDVNDKFALDYNNGMSTPLPINLDFDNSQDGGIENWGFTGLMVNGVSNYKNLFNPVGMTVGGAALKFTVDAASEGEAFAAGNNQENAFQFGVNLSSTQWNYIVQTRVTGPYQGFTPVNFQSMGMYIGTGDQDNFLRIICHSNNGLGGIQVLKEVSGVPIGTVYSAPILNTSYVDFFLHINPTTLLVQPSYAINGGNPINVGPAISIPSGWLSPNALAVGIISSSNGPGVAFPATWDFIKVYYDQSSVPGQWHTINSTTTPTARHECSYVSAGDKFYLLGGRGIKPVQCFHPTDSAWSSRSAPPVEIHHFQAVEYNGLIYAMCGFTGNFPNEVPLSNIYIYDPVGDTWTIGPEIPVNRRRGSAGCTIYNNKIYVVCGIKNGHLNGWVPWLDVFDPINNTWTVLPDAPRERDHFSVAIVEDKIYALGGRKTGFGGNTFNATVPQVDIYNISNSAWSTLPSPSGDLPTPRAAAAVALLGNEILVIGGESGAQTSAHNETEALNFITETWREIASLNQGRHGTQAIVSNGNVYVAAGSKIRGNDEINSQEVFYFFNPSTPNGTQIIKGNITSSTTSKNFSLVLLAEEKTSTINLSNSGGNQVLMVNELSLSDTTNYKITNFPNLPISIAPNGQFALNLKFQPLSLGLKNATIHIEHSGTNGPVDVSLTGECVLTIPCEEYPTEQNGLLVLECENGINIPVAWEKRTNIPNYTGTGFLRYTGQEYINNPGNQMFTYKINITNPGRYRFQQRSYNDGSLSNYNNDYWIKFPHGGARKFQLGYDRGPLIGWFKIYQNHANTWTYQTAAVEENPHDVYVDFDVPGTYEIQVSARANGIMLDRYMFYKVPVTETQATTALPLASTITCIEVAWFADNDNDLFGNQNDIVLSIVKPVGYVLNSKDCDDANAYISPAGVEIQDGIDNNCNGVIDEGFGAPKALLVVGNIALNAGDQSIKDRIAQLGYDVAVMSGSQATTLAGEAMNLIFISSTINSADVGTKFTSLGVPVINCEPNLMDDLLMTVGSSTKFGTVSNVTQINLKAAPHPLAGNLTNGIKSVYTGLNKLVWGKPEVAATPIATTTTDSTQIVIFGYDNNAQMVNIKAPSRRVGFFLNDLSANALTPDGIALLDAALKWATNYSVVVNTTIGDALFVVGNTTLTVSDLAIKTRLEGLGFNVSVVSGSASQASDATGKELILISSTITTNDVNTKFTNVAVPLLNWEPGLSDDLKMTSTSSTTGTNASAITILNSTHPMAAGLPLGQVTVYTVPDKIIYSSNVSANAIKIARTGGTATNNNITLYGYEKNASMVGLNAPERRVGFFMHDLAGSLLTSNGYLLFDAAIRWLTEGLNNPPAFNISGNITADEDFTGTKTVTVTPLPAIIGEENQVATYSISPASVSFANVSFSSVTGHVSISSKPNEFGIQEFIITANDGQSSNNTYEKTFTLTVNPVNDAPAFNVSGNVTELKNFAGTKTVTVTPNTVPSNEASQTVTYTLNPSSVSFANVSVNGSTGQVSITSIPEQTGFQIFTITANDGQNSFNTSTKQFYLAINSTTSNAICYNCGGPQFISATGDTFKSDFYFSGGTLTYTNNNIADIQNTFDDNIFRTERNATAFSYNVPVANGVYKVRLYFAETYFGATGGSATGGAGSRVFHVNLEGTQMLSYFDIFAQANGAEKAIMREFTNVAVSDGFLNIAFNSVINKAKISGFCIVPDGNANTPPSFAISGNIAETKNFAGTRSVTVTPDPVPAGEVGQVVTYLLSPATVPFANISFNNSTGQVNVTSIPNASGFQQFTITANDGQSVNNTVSKTFYLAVNETRSKALCWNCGGPQYVSVVGDTFRSDLYFTSGAFTATNNTIVDVLNTFDDFIFRSERNSGSFGYNIPAANGLYKVKLLFAETYFGADGGTASGGIGSRVFNVSLEGTQVLANYDIFFKAGGAARAVIEEFDSLQITDGFINIAFTALVNKAKISGICIVPYTNNEPPAFSLSTSTLTLAEDFAGTQTITATPDPVPPSDAGDVVTYSLSPASTGVASVSINPTTGTISIIKLNNKNGTQVFSVIANDGKPFGTFSRSFTLNVTPVNDAPAFTLNSNIILAKNFSPPVSVQVTPAPVPTDEVSQVVTYSLSPPTSSFANVAINAITGQVTFSSINNAYGSQQFTIFADDAQLVNNVASQNFTLTVSLVDPNAPKPVFINCGNGPQYISLTGDTFKTDNYYTTGASAFTNNSIPDILNTGDDVIYRTERFSGSLGYNIPVRNGSYNISLHFAELYYGATGGQPANGGPGKRVFNVSLEGTQVLTNFDTWVAAGNAAGTATVQTFTNVPITDGQVNLLFAAVINNAKVNAISIVPVAADCAGVQGGLATVNSCGICVGGTTGLPLNSGKDCAGVCGGTAFLNDCNICVGGTTGHGSNQGKDCNGVCNGTAYLNDCNICVGGNTGLGVNQGKDCAGVCGGTATLNSCSICTGGTTGVPANQGKDCAGVCGGTATLNACNICVGGNTGLGVNQGKDCAGVCGGTATLNSCNICTGGTTGVPANQGKDCAGVCNGTAYLNDCSICVGGTTGLGANQGKDACGVCGGNGSSCAPPCVANEVISFTLMRTGTLGEIGPLTSGMTINLATIGSFSVRANTCNGQNVGSVRFFVNGSTVRTESTAPYAINGDSPAGSYIAWNPTVGSKTLTGTPYTGASGSGTVGISETVTFTVINQATTTDCAGVLNGTATINSCNICVGGTTGLPLTQGKDCAGVCNGTATINSCGICTGGTTGLGANQGKDCLGICNGTATVDACGVCNGNGSTCGGCTPVSISSLTLTGICTAGDIAEITNGMIINLANTPDFAVRANVCNAAAVKSVRFIVNGTTFRTENTSPYAINGDTPSGCYKKWYVNAMPYTLTVIAYSGLNATGTVSASFTRTFTIVNQASKMEENSIESPVEESSLQLYPNPNTGKFIAEYYAPEVNNLTIKIYNHLGQNVYTNEKLEFVGELKESIDLDAHPAGMYFLQMQHGDKRILKKIIVKD